MSRAASIFLLLIAIAFAGCGEAEEAEAPKTASMTLSFEAKVGATLFSCESDFDALGSTSATLTPTDLKLFIHDVELIDAGGDAVAFDVEDDGIWQVDGIALLDFEDAKGSCSNGTAETHMAVTGSAPEGQYTGIRFKVGVPFSHNHSDPATAPAPLSYTSMHWNWQGGYKFIRFDASNGSMEGFRLHLGSTGCEGTTGDISSCARPNRPEISLEGFDPSSETITLDIAEMVAGADVSTNAPDTAPGCMSAPDDSDCDAIFSNIGLSRETGEAMGSSKIFKLQ